MQSQFFFLFWQPFCKLRLDRVVNKENTPSLTAVQSLHRVHSEGMGGGGSGGRRTSQSNQSTSQSVYLYMYLLIGDLAAEYGDFIFGKE